MGNYNILKNMCKEYKKKDNKSNLDSIIEEVAVLQILQA